MENQSFPPNIDEYLFGQGLTVADYYIEQTPVSEVVCYRNTSGREFDVHIDHAELAEAVLQRLKQLGVHVVRLGLHPGRCWPMQPRPA